MKTLTARLLAPAALFGALLLSSCGAFHIGDRIRSGSELHAGTASHHPVAYFYKQREVPADIHSPDVRLVPEVTYRVKRPLCDIEPGADAHLTVMDVTPTGRLLYVGGHGKIVDESAVAGMARRSLPTRPLAPDAYTMVEELGDIDSPYATRGSLGAQIAAAPFDFVIDPALSAVSIGSHYVALGASYTVLGAVCVAATPFWFTYYLFDRDALPPWAVFYL